MSDKNQSDWLVECHETWVEKSKKAKQHRQVEPPLPPRQEQTSEEEPADPNEMTPEETWDLLMDNLE